MTEHGWMLCAYIVYAVAQGSIIALSIDSDGDTLLDPMLVIFFSIFAPIMSVLLIIALIRVAITALVTRHYSHDVQISTRPDPDGRWIMVDHRGHQIFSTYGPDETITLEELIDILDSLGHDVEIVDWQQQINSNP